MASITINEREYDLLTIDKLTFGEQRKLKKLTGGMSLSRIADGLDEMDADAWYGVVLLSVLKQNPRFTEAELVDINMVDLLGAMKDDDEDAEVLADPPAPAAPEVADEPASASTSSSDGAATLETGGTLTSPASSE